MHRSVRATVAVGGLVAASAVLSSSPVSAIPGDDYFVVNTQIGGPSSPIVEAGGTFSDCYAVEDLGETTTEYVSPNRVMFIGDKRVLCDGGTVTIHYNATQVASGKRTMGHWFVVDSTLEGVTKGFGTVRGDIKRCTPAPGTDFCILDTFSGNTE